jgi:hypothetical protein
MRVEIKKLHTAYEVECESAIVTVSSSACVHIDKNSVLVFIDGFQFAQYVLSDPKPNKKVLPFQAETKRYRPEKNKMSVLPQVSFLNAVADNFINFWRGLLK